jgi:hypothetical protein
MTWIGPLALLLLVAILFSGCVQEETRPGSPQTTPVPGATAQGTTTASPEATPDESLGGPVRFVPGGQYDTGDKILLTGTTILSPGNELLIEVTELAFSPTTKEEGSAFSGAAAIVTVRKGPEGSENTWEYTLDTTGFAPGGYQVLISGIQVTGFQKSAYFTLLP